VDVMKYDIRAAKAVSETEQAESKKEDGAHPAEIISGIVFCFDMDKPVFAVSSLFICRPALHQILPRAVDDA